MRDSQRSKVYAAENAITKGRLFEEMDSVKAFVAKVQASSSLQKKYGEFLSPHIHVGDGRARRKAGGNAQGIWMPKWSRSELIICHELAHTISSRKYRVRWTAGGSADKIAGHGWEFCEVYLDLVRVMLGNSTAEELKQSFTKHKVRFRPKKTISPERMEKLREQGRKLARMRQEARDGQSREATA